MKTSEFIEIPKGRGILVFRGISREESEIIIDALQKWWESKKDVLILTHPSLDFDVEFKRPDPEVLEEILDERQESPPDIPIL